MMYKQITNKYLRTHWIGWIIGLIIFSLIVFFTYTSDVADYLHFFTPVLVISWCLVTLFARLLMMEAFVQPILALNYPIKRTAAFWLGWLRTFFNQVVPLSGVTLVAAYCKKKCGLDWGQIAALTSPLVFVTLAVTGAFATFAILINYSNIGYHVIPLAGASFAFTVLSALIVIKGPGIVAYLPLTIRSRIESMGNALQVFSKHKNLLKRLIFYYTLIIILRYVRLWLLFVIGTDLSLNMGELLFIAAISEFAFLVPFIPGGLGIREGAMVAAAWLLGINIDMVAIVALMDRVFSVVVISFMALPAFILLRRDV